MSYYTTLARARDELRASSTIDDQILRRYIEMVSDRIDGIMGVKTAGKTRPFFLPYTETRQFPITPYAIDSRQNTFQFPDGLLSLISASIEGTTVTSSLSVYPTNASPARKLRMNNTSNWYQYPPTDYNTPSVLSVTGVWGFNADYTNAWLNEDTLQAGIISSDTTLTIADVDGLDSYGYTPRFSAGNYIKVDDEVMLIVTTNTITNVMNVRRAVLGTTASTHSNGSNVAVYQVDSRIERITSRQAGLLYARRGAFTSETTPEGGVVSYPTDLQSELTRTLTEVQYG